MGTELEPIFQKKKLNEPELSDWSNRTELEHNAQ